MRLLLVVPLLLALTPAALAGEESSLERDLERAARRAAWNEASIAARKLGAANSKAAVDALLSSAIRFPFGSVYQACINALAKVDSEEAVARLVDKLTSGKSTEQMVLCDACAKRSDPATGAALPKVLGERKQEVQRAAAAAVKRRKLTAAIDPLIAGLTELEQGSDKDGLTQFLFQDALQGITGETLTYAEDWKNWWAAHKDGFKPTAGRKRKKKSATKARPRFFGSEIVSNRVVFVIDISGSMLATDPPTDGSSRRPVTGADKGPKIPGLDSRVRIDRAKAQLELVVRALPSDARFTILAFSGQLYRGPGGFSVFSPKVKVPRRAPSPLPPKMGDVQWLYVWKRRPRLQKATDSNKKKAVEFIRRLKAGGSTFTLQALKYALEVKGADLVVLLSDGAPTEIAGLKSPKMLTPRQIKDELMRINRFKRIRIDTFQVTGSMGGFGAFADFLKNVAKMTGGKFTEVR